MKKFLSIVSIQAKRAIFLVYRLLSIELFLTFLTRWFFKIKPHIPSMTGPEIVMLNVVAVVIIALYTLREWDKDE
ncbi:hypothetical protein KJZ61_03010 [Candidatus Dependentiae bacterium]|nr:hypothetical protein [Candidatus Dependentiae bacterium]